MYHVDRSSIAAECFSYCQQARHDGDRFCCSRSSLDQGVALFFTANLVGFCVATDSPVLEPVRDMIVAMSSDPSLCSTSVVEDGLNHDEVVGLRLSYTHDDCFFTVLLSSETSESSSRDESSELGHLIIKSLLNRYNAACTWTEQDKTVEDVDKRLDPVWQEAEDLIRTVAFDTIKVLSYEHRCETSPTSNAELTSGDDLADYLFPKAFNLQIVPESKGFSAVVRPDLPLSLPFAVEANVSIRSGLMCVRPQEIYILKRYRAHILKVRIGIDIFCCKLNNSGAQNSFLRELNVLQQLHDMSRLNGLRVPRLRGVVAVSDGVIGLLLDLVETEDPDLMALLRRKKDIPDPTRQKWADQISSTLQELHILGLVWGDAKTGNVLIDHNEDAWLIDFGGGFTRGWVEEAFYDTQQGDLQGLRNTLMDVFGER